MTEEKYTGDFLGWFSCGITSAIACYLYIKKYSKERVHLYYIDIKTAHTDNDRFIADFEKWLDVKVNRISSKKYSDQFEVIRGERFVNGPGGAKCTSELKKKVRIQLEKQMGYPPQIFGYEFDKKQINRAVRFSEQYPYSNPAYPLIETQINKNNCAGILLKNGIKLPAMYELGYHNNNCIGCVKGGKGYWNKIRNDFPETFDKMVDAERYIGRSCIKGVFLDQLNPLAGKNEAPVLPDCGTFCEIDFADLISDKTDKILLNPSDITQLYTWNTKNVL
jgi:hypothetical protein